MIPPNRRCCRADLTAGTCYENRGPDPAAADLDAPPDSDDLIAYGPLLSDDGSAWLGTAALVRAPDGQTARGVLTPGRYADVEVHAWEFGGRR